VSSAANTAAASHHAAASCSAHAAAAAHHRLGLALSTAAASCQSGQQAAAAASVVGHALVDALGVALLVALLAFAGAETHGCSVVGWIVLCSCQMNLRGVGIESVRWVFLDSSLSCW